MRFNTYEVAYGAAYFFIEIQQKFVPLLEERAYIVLVVFEKRGGPVSRSDSIPMQMPPLSVVGYYECLSWGI